MQAQESRNLPSVRCNVLLGVETGAGGYVILARGTCCKTKRPAQGVMVKQPNGEMRK